MKTFFITGTDTDCGKTYVTCQLLNHLHRFKKKAFAIKPVASGGLQQNGQLISEDVINLQKYNQHLACPVNGWTFSSPISPHLAAREEGSTLTIKEIAAFCFDESYASLDYLLIEGAGGLLVPLNEKETWLDFLSLSKVPVVLVVGMRLGCINHALLTASVLHHYGLPSLGWIANCLDKNMLALEENIATLVDRMPMPLIGTVPHEGAFVSHSLILENL
ncbi:Dethiobiotin synthetase [Legionella lansingensis]|uniref:ATP-dependent dethiobiotin synthetase BioD n=1 Tax=Legionella lansingensis TaxID=45067 RepID=A0A0W0VTE7_9GAMM|nr:dethiobiotin synthase [Legionella lansingensis]KTD23435.1 Dethiobiotin synthetase [Legionella lansingensis]SNV50913.1 Dethiobiotin synthetase [Legionella lansingensis]